jgi:hypothetical protein
MRKDGEKRGEGKRGEERGPGGEKWIEGSGTSCCVELRGKKNMAE